MPIVTYYSSDKREEDLMDVACDIYVGEQKCLQGFVGKSRRKEATWET
jgi:hypothetical protein